jgi:hypothetical protein
MSNAVESTSHARRRPSGNVAEALSNPRLRKVGNSAMRADLARPVSLLILLFTIHSSCRSLHRNGGFYDGRVVSAARSAPAPASPPGASKSFEIPLFYWPPPAPSTRWDIPAARLLPTPNTLGDVYDRLRPAIEAAGYSEYTHFQVSNGFVLVTPLECIDDYGCPTAERWSLDTPPLRWFSVWDISTYLTHLFTHQSKRVRILVVTVSDISLTTSPRSLEYSEASRWMSCGANNLPEELLSRGLSPAHVISFLVYEFARSAATGAVSPEERSRTLAKDQLACSGLALQFTQP